MVLLAAAAAGLTACRDGESRAATGRVTVTTNGAGDVETPVRSAKIVYNGVNHAHVHRRGLGYGSPNSARELDSLRGIGVNSIAVTPFGYQEGATADRIVGFDTSGTEDLDPSLRDLDLAAEIDSAHARGMTVMLKPHIWSHDFWGGGEWHGTVRQTTEKEHASWWSSYRAFALHYAGLAEKYHAEIYCVGTELVLQTAAYPDEWRQLIADVRKVYRGKVIYAAHWERELDAIRFWDALDAVGVNAYFPLEAPPNATVEQLLQAWKPHLERIEKMIRGTDRGVILTEVGYRPVALTYREPWTYSGGDFDPDAQARAFEALFRAFYGREWMEGIFIWKTFTDPARASRHGEDTGFAFRGRPAESVIRNWFRGG